jgi:cytochrome c556
MWLAGMQEPDFRTISDFRKDRVNDIKELFKQVLGTCGDLGMVKCGRISLDGTKIEANSSKNKMTYRKSLMKRKGKYDDIVDKIFEEAKKIDAEEDALYGDHDGYSMDREYTSEEIKKALEKVKRERKKLADEEEKAKSKIAVIEEKIQRMGNKRNSFGNTDKDATLMLMKEGYLGVGYNVQMATENQVIVGYEAFENPNDVNLLEAMVEEIENNLGKTPEYLTADKGYGSQSNYEYVEKKGIKAAIPHQHYDTDRVARNRGQYKLSRNLPYEKIKLRMMDFLETEEGKELMNIRKHDIEATFGDVKHNMGFRKFLVRFKPKVRVELGLISIAHNIKKMKKWIEFQGLAPVNS